MLAAIVWSGVQLTFQPQGNKKKEEKSEQQRKIAKECPNPHEQKKYIYISPEITFCAFGVQLRIKLYFKRTNQILERVFKHAVPCRYLFSSAQ